MLKTGRRLLNPAGLGRPGGFFPAGYPTVHTWRLSTLCAREIRIAAGCPASMPKQRLATALDETGFSLDPGTFLL